MQRRKWRIQGTGIRLALRRLRRNACSQTSLILTTRDSCWVRQSPFQNTSVEKQAEKICSGPPSRTKPKWTSCWPSTSSIGTSWANSLKRIFCRTATTGPLRKNWTICFWNSCRVNTFQRFSSSWRVMTISWDTLQLPTSSPTRAYSTWRVFILRKWHSMSIFINSRRTSRISPRLKPTTRAPGRLSKRSWTPWKTSGREIRNTTENELIDSAQLSLSFTSFFDSLLCVSWGAGCWDGC